MAEEYVCPKCSEKLGREARHKPGSQIWNEHLKFKHGYPVKNNPESKPEDTEIIINESDTIPEDIIQDILDNEAEIETKEQNGKSVFVVKIPNASPDKIPLDKIPPNAIWIETTQGVMKVIRDNAGKAVGLFDPEWSIEKINFRKEYWGYYVPDPSEFECRRFETRPFTEIEKLRYARSIAEAKHKKYSWIQECKDKRKMRELMVKKNAKSI